MPPQRIRLSRRKGFRLPPNAVNVARPSKWGNPFVVGRDGSRDECVCKYKALMSGFLCASARAASFHEQDATVGHVKRNLWRLRGKDLACWCPLDGKPCHADVLLALANGLQIEPVRLTRIG